MAYPAKAVANYFVEKAIQEQDKTLTLMKLLKEIYITHGWCLALYDRPLIKEAVQAWQYGPVVEEVFQAFRHWGMQPIQELYEELNYDDEKEELIIAPPKADFSAEDKALMDKIWQICKKNTGIDLSNWTHREGSAWYQAWHHEGASKYRYFKINNTAIKQEFEKEKQKNAGCA